MILDLVPDIITCFWIVGHDGYSIVVWLVDICLGHGTRFGKMLSGKIRHAKMKNMINCNKTCVR